MRTSMPTWRSAIVAVHRSPGVIVLLLMLAFGAILTYRLFRASVLAAANDVTVRNFSRTRTLARRESEGFRIGPMSGQPFGQTIHVLLRDDTILPLDATSRPLPFAQGK